MRTALARVVSTWDRRIQRRARTSTPAVHVLLASLEPALGTGRAAVEAVESHRGARFRPAPVALEQFFPELARWHARWHPVAPSARPRAHRAGVAESARDLGVFRAF